MAAPAPNGASFALTGPAVYCCAFAGMAAKRKHEGRQLGRVLEFMERLWALVHELQSISKRMDARLGVTGPQRLVIRIIGRYPGMSAGELAAAMHVHPSTLTGVLERLIDRKLLVRGPDPRDGRRTLLHLTAAGRRMDTQRAGTVEAAVRRALRRMRPSTTSEARLALEILIDEMSRSSK